MILRELSREGQREERGWQKSKEIRGVKGSQSDSAQQGFQALGFHDSSALDDGWSCSWLSHPSFASATGLEGRASAR